MKSKRPGIDFSRAGMARAMKDAPPPKARAKETSAALDAETAARECMEFIDKRGMPPMSKGSWIEMLEVIISECRMRMELTRAELRKEESNP